MQSRNVTEQAVVIMDVCVTEKALMHSPPQTSSASVQPRQTVSSVSRRSRRASREWDMGAASFQWENMQNIV